MEIKNQDYSVIYDISNETITFEGSLRLNGLEDYSEIVQLLDNVVEQEPSKVTLNLQNLQFLNSSGISILSKFVINIRKQKNIQMIVLGSQAIPWQSKSLKNWQRLMPSLKLELV
jgi:hypothetical protein